MATDERTIELAFEAAKLGAEWFAGRQLRKDEEAALLARVRRKEAARVIPTVEELERSVKNPAARDTPDEES